MRVKDAIRYIIDSCTDIYSPGESESIAIITLDFIGFPRKLVFLSGEVEISNQNEEFIQKVVREIKRSRPIQYILGETEFIGLKFRVDSNVLIPRQETEELVLRIVRENKKINPVILDIGTGSGCIAVTLAKNIPSAIIYASDISQTALSIARENARLNSVKVHFIEDDILKTHLDKNKRLDIIVSNPPYVCNSEKEFMHKNVLNFEPALALFVRDENPLEYYNAISEFSFERLIGGGLLYVEINEKFGQDIIHLFIERGFTDPEIIRDINEKDRFVKAIKP